MRARDIIEAESGSARAFLKKLGKVDPGDSEFAWENFNPDAAIDSGDLDPWINFVSSSAQRVADYWFPGQASRRDAVIDIRSYLLLKHVAMNLRLLGNVAGARRYEDRCDRLYLQLPEYARW